ncbi:MAG: hypothetical protein KC620_13915 [Myxococcales bacterium]|nr:hypothetical protein [Myxococcales bacterium]
MGPILAFLLVVLFAHAPTARAAETGAVAAEAAYFEGLDHFREKDYAAARAAFERALTLGPAPEVRRKALQALVRSALELSATDLAGGCEVVTRFAAPIERLDPKTEAGAEAQGDLRALRTRCAEAKAPVAPSPAAPETPEPPFAATAPPAAPTRALPWVLSGLAVVATGAAVTTNLLARDALDDRDAARDRFWAAADEAARLSAAHDFGYHQGVAESRATASYALFAAAGLFAGGALWAFFDGPSTPPPVSAHGPAALCFSW